MNTPSVALRALVGQMAVSAREEIARRAAAHEAWVAQRLADLRVGIVRLVDKRQRPFAQNPPAHSFVVSGYVVRDAAGDVVSERGLIHDAPTLNTLARFPRPDRTLDADTLRQLDAILPKGARASWLRRRRVAA